MINHQGVRRDTADIGDGVFYAENTRFAIGGEIQRRPGLSLATAQTGLLMTHFWHPATGTHAVFATSSGALVAVAL